MQCYEYLAIQQYARRHLGSWTRRYDDLDLAEMLDERHVRRLPDIKRMRNAASESAVRGR